MCCYKPGVTVFMGLWRVTAPVPMTTASKSALSLKPHPTTDSGQKRRRREDQKKRTEVLVDGEMDKHENKR